MAGETPHTNTHERRTRTQHTHAAPAHASTNACRARTRTPPRAHGSSAPSCERRTPNTRSSAHMNAVVAVPGTGPNASLERTLSHARRTRTPSSVPYNRVPLAGGSSGLDASRDFATTSSGEGGRLLGATEKDADGSSGAGFSETRAAAAAARGSKDFSAAVGQGRGGASGARREDTAAEGPRGGESLWSRDPQALPGRRLLAGAGDGAAAAGALRGRRGEVHPGQPGAAHERPPG